MSNVDCLFCWEGKTEKYLFQVSANKFLIEENLGVMLNETCSKGPLL